MEHTSQKDHTQPAPFRMPVGQQASHQRSASVPKPEVGPVRSVGKAVPPGQAHLFHCRRRISSRVHIMEPRRRQFTEAGTRS